MAAMWWPVGAGAICRVGLLGSRGRLPFTYLKRQALLWIGRISGNWNFGLFAYSNK